MEITKQTIAHWHSLSGEDQITYYMETVGTNLSRMLDWHSHLTNYYKELEKDNRRYIYLITFTKKDPNMEDDDIEKYIISKFQKDSIIEAHMAKEKTKNGVSHWHVSVISKTFITKKPTFQYYIKKYGYVDISKTRSKTLKNGIKYISKDSTPIKIK